MANRLARLLGAGAVVAMLGTAPVLAQDDISEWDTDGDGVLTEEEFSEAPGDIDMFEEWDVNDDDMLSEEEFRAGVFRTYDENGDGELDEDELVDVEDEEDFWDLVILCPEEQARPGAR